MAQPGPAAPFRAGRPELRRPQPAKAAPTPSPRQSRSGGGGRRALVVLLVLALTAICVVGLPYYSQPMAGRVRSPFHDWLKSSGYIGQSTGLVALAFFLFLWLYPLRKKFRWLAWTGAMSRWLDTHVLAALALPLLVTVHAAWRFTGLIGLGFWSMMVVWVSGIAGRYIYARIPRSRAGVELTMDEIAGRRDALLAQIAERSGLDAATVATALAAPAQATSRLGIWGTLKRMIADDLARRAAGRRLRRLWRSRGPKRRAADRKAIRAVLRLARQEVALSQQARMLDATQAVFRYWHVFHRPVAFAALVAVLVHVAVVVSLGATWLW